MCFFRLYADKYQQKILEAGSWSPIIFLHVDPKCGNPSCSRLHRCHQPNSTSQSPRLWHNHSSQGETCGANMEGDLFFPEATYWLITAWSVRLIYTYLRSSGMRHNLTNWCTILTEGSATFVFHIRFYLKAPHNWKMSARGGINLNYITNNCI